VKVTRDKTENSQVFLTVEMEPAEVEESLEKAYRRLVKKVNMPGFRRGKAPRDLLERHIGKERLFEEALDKLLPEAYEKAIDEQKIEPFAQPQIEITQTDPVIFTATVPIPPTVELGDYRSIEIEPKPVEISEDDINATIDQMRHERATWEPVERPVNFGDLIVLDVEGTIDNEPILNQQGAQYPVLKDSSYPAPGFAEQLTGMNVGGEKEFKLQFPSDYPKEELAGKEPLFKVKVTEVKQENLPELNDDFAKEIGAEFETADALREKVSQRLKLRAEEIAKADFEERVVEAVADQASIEFPPILVEAEIDRLLKEQLQRSQMKVEDLEEYLKRTNKSVEELREEFRPVATKKVTQSLVIGKVIEAEGIEVSDSEVEAEIEKAIDSANEKKEELRKFLDSPQARQSIKNSLTAQKSVQRLVEVAKGVNKNHEKTQEGEKNE